MDVISSSNFPIREVQLRKDRATKPLPQARNKLAQGGTAVGERWDANPQSLPRVPRGWQSHVAIAARLGGQRVGGLQMIVTDRSVLDAPELGLELGSALLKLYPANWELDRLIELLGNQSTVAELKSGKDPRCIAQDYQPKLQQLMRVRQKYLIYTDSLNAE